MRTEHTTIACRACGHVNPHGSSFCRVCGAALAPLTERLPISVRSSPQPRGRRTPRGAIVGAVAAAGAGIGAAALIVLASGTGSHGRARSVPPSRIEHVTGTTAAIERPSPSGVVHAGGWPRGVAGYTVALASDRTQADARQAAEKAVVRGLPSVGFLWSSEYRSLRPGYWFVFSGVYSSAAAAAENVPAATAAGFAGAYPRRVAR